MFLGLDILPIVGLVSIGGWGEVSARLAVTDPLLLTWSGSQSLSLEGIFGILSLALIGVGFLGSPQIFVRFLALRDESEISRGAAVAIVWTVLADSGAVLIGMIGRAMLDGNPGEAVLPQLVELLMPAFFVGLYIAIVLSAIMSTADSLLVLAASAVVRDFYQKVRHPEIPDEALVGMSRKATVTLAGVALTVSMVVALVTPDRSVFWFVIFGWSGIAATFCPTIILSLFWSRMTGKGAIAAMVAGFLGVPLFAFGAPHLPGVGHLFKALAELPPAFALSFLVGIIVSLRTAAPSRASADLDFARGTQ